MTLILTEGFETIRNDSDLVSDGKWSSVGVWYSLTAAATGNYGAMFGGRLTKLLGANEHATVIAGGAFNFVGGFSNDIMRMLGDNGVTEHIVLRQSGGQLIVDRGSTQLAITTTTPVPGINAWPYLEMKVVLGDGTSGSVEVRKDGVAIPELTLTGIDTKNAGTEAVIDAVDFGSVYNGGQPGIDDLYIATGAGDAPFNTFLGPLRVWPLAPNGNGNYSQGVGSDGNSVDNYLLVDELAPNASSADHVAITTDGQKDTYALTNLTPTTGTVIGVSVGQFADKNDSGVKKFRTVVRSGGTDATGTDKTLGMGAISRFISDYPLNPVTGVAWTISEINALEVGFEARP